MNKIDHRQFDPKVTERIQVEQVKNIVVQHQFEDGKIQKKNNLLGSILHESLLTRNQKIAIENQRAKSQLRNHQAKIDIDNEDDQSEKRSPSPSKRKLTKVQLLDEIQQNDDMGFIPPRTISRLQRIRQITFEQFERQFIKSSNNTIVKLPAHLDYFNFKREQNAQELVKKILNGEYDLDEEEKRLNELLYSTMSKSQLSGIKINKDDKKVNKAMFVQARAYSTNKKMADTQNSNDIPWITQPPKIQKKAKKHNKITFGQQQQENNLLDLNEVFEKGENQMLMSHDWSLKKDISPSRRVTFINKINNSIISNNSQSPNRMNNEYVKSVVKDIITKSNEQIKINPMKFEQMKEIDSQKSKFGKGISKYLDYQDNTREAFDKNNQSILEIIQESEFAKKQNRENLTGREVIEKVRQENFSNSVYVNFLGKGKIWKPDKSYILSGRKNKVLNLQMTNQNVQYQNGIQKKIKYWPFLYKIILSQFQQKVFFQQKRLLKQKYRQV
ncbi:UNKNOWN [Stylonychia lemnae]|uniref:Uncharacterized protein n=1 Tax=Stylonychia lemnae TaxID=5949 RepID=A0A078A6D7_STYLE|nr:UNKNOWN [Stylonychia lemnae]|eukprot:CDW77426.1 UNKNOWN [Stylonychia lemnae]